jgi:hypothetical protein
MSTESWTTDGPRLTDDGVLLRLRNTIDNESALIVEHRFYKGSRAPHRFVTDDFDALRSYLRQQGQPGDSFYMWRFEDCCTNDNVAERGKIPDSQGRVPIGGSY